MYFASYALLLLATLITTSWGDNTSTGGVDWTGGFGNATISLSNTICGAQITYSEISLDEAGITVSHIDPSSTAPLTAENSFVDFGLVDLRVNTDIEVKSHDVNINTAAVVTQFFNLTFHANKDGSVVINGTLINDGSQTWNSSSGIPEVGGGLLLQGYNDTCDAGNIDVTRKYYFQNGTQFTLVLTSLNDLNGEGEVTITNGTLWCGTCRTGPGPFLNVGTIDSFVVKATSNSGTFNGTLNPTGGTSTVTGTASSSTESSHHNGAWSVYSASRFSTWTFSIISILFSL